MQSPILQIVLLVVANTVVAHGSSSKTAVDLVIVTKHEHTLVLLSNGTTVARYGVALGRTPSGQKTCEGDNRTPAGSYVLDSLNMASKYHLAFHVSYPNASDRARAARARCSAGGDIMVHGLPRRLGWLGPLHRVLDWTHGCIAMTDRDMDDLARTVRAGTKIRIDPRTFTRSLFKVSRRAGAIPTWRSPLVARRS